MDTRDKENIIFFFALSLLKLQGVQWQGYGHLNKYVELWITQLELNKLMLSVLYLRQTFKHKVCGKFSAKL
jgi:hypothetical protein